eukprot:1159524-Pelagomonas_calceolata.AAC.7
MAHHAVSVQASSQFFHQLQLHMPSCKCVTVPGVSRLIILTRPADATWTLVSIPKSLRDACQSIPCVMLARAYRASLMTLKAFWTALLHEDIEFKRLVDAFAKIEASAKRTDKVFKVLLERWAQRP